MAVVQQQPRRPTVDAATLTVGASATYVCEPETMLAASGLQLRIQQEAFVLRFEMLAWRTRQSRLSSQPRYLHEIGRVHSEMTQKGSSVAQTPTIVLVRAPSR